MKPSEELRNIVMSSYIQDLCAFCLQKIGSLDEAKKSVWYPWKKGRAAHKECYDEGVKNG